MKILNENRLIFIGEARWIVINKEILKINGHDWGIALITALKS